MYILINKQQYTCVRRKKTADEVHYYGLNETPEKVSGVITMCSNEGFVLSEDKVEDYLRYEANGSMLTLTNYPIPPEPPEPPVPPEPPEPPQPSAEEVLLEIAADHEERLCNIELFGV